MAQWTADKWAEYGFTSRLDEYYVYLNYPVSHSLLLTYPNGSTFTPSLQEAVLEEDETTSYPNRIPTFHGYSKSGNASAEYVYVGRGQQVDFERLQALGVELEGKIAVAKYAIPPSPHVKPTALIVGKIRRPVQRFKGQECPRARNDRMCHLYRS